ncbi:hypothetical protein BCL32_2340 [Rhizobium mongolense USDA 1844]|uniref:Uncharacterized protein n=1 Tax=Rhizobium mongolense USDA 1844 TaxID=1079460 RepID=A0A559THF0_9HYPH|nr:hypothetical protein BCL32_2340 [Rhizobium mongolense USDA 1844]
MMAGDAASDNDCLTSSPRPTRALQDATDRARGYVEAANSANTRRACAADWKPQPPLFHAPAGGSHSSGRPGRHAGDAGSLRGLRDRAMPLVGLPEPARFEIIGLNLARDQTEDGLGWLIEIERQPPYLLAYPIRRVQTLALSS